jgi:uncharacterized protein YndB with AHSA1/START domain
MSASRWVAFAAISSLCPSLAAAQTPAAPESRLASQLPGKTDTGRTVRLEADVACPPARAYALWATGEGAQSFFAPRARIGGVGGLYQVMFFPEDDPEGRVHGTAGAHVLAAEPGHFYAFEWVVFAGDDLRGASAPPYADAATRLPAILPTWVELTFTPAGTGAHVAFRHYGFGPGALYERSRAWFERAWGGVLQQMVRRCAG